MENTIYTDLYNQVKNSTSNYREYIPGATVSKIIRYELHKNFPGQKFSIVTRHGNSINIDWENGPTQKMVESAVDYLESSGFDGSIDLAYDHYHYLTPEGIFYGGTSGTEGSMGMHERVIKSQPKNSIMVSLGSDYISYTRSLSQDQKEKLFNNIKEEYADFEYITLEQYEAGKLDYSQSRIVTLAFNDLDLYSKKSETKKEESKQQQPEKPEEPKNETGFNLEVEHDRDWTWLKFPCKPSEEIREALKSNGARFSGKRIQWYFTKHVEKSEIESMLSGIISLSKNEEIITQEEEKPTEPENKINLPLVEKLEKLADSMTDVIDGKLNSATGQQNYTAKRARVAAGMYEDGIQLQKIQTILKVLAGMHREGTINPSLAGINNKKVIEVITHYSKFPNVNPDHWMYKDQQSLIKAGIDNNNFSQVKELLLSMTDTRKLEAAKKQKELENKVKSLIGQIPGFFPTPENVASEIIEMARIEDGNTILEPSAGAGNLADVIKRENGSVKIDVIEYNSTLKELLQSKGYNLIADDFMTYNNGKRFDRVIMNPPFENGQDIDHVKHAYDLLSENGRLVSIMSVGPFFRNDKKSSEFREWFDNLNGAKFDLPEGSFKQSLTGVNTCCVVIDK
jgi:hypothetical protein